MNSQELKEKYLPLVSKYRIPIAFTLLGLIFFGYGLIPSLRPVQQTKKDILFEGASDTKAIATKTTIQVDVEGEVQKPGVYILPEESCVQDALVASGGLAADADRGKVAKTINLAAKLTDGAKIYFPSVQDVTASQTVMGSSTTSGTVNINDATESQLEDLPGIGKVSAQKIIDNRPYQTVDELQSKKIVNKKVFEEIKDKIIIY